MCQLDPKDFVFVDDTGVNIARTRWYARAPKGARIPASTPVHKGKNATVFGALSLTGITAAMTREGRTETHVFLPFMQTLRAPTFRSGQRVILDNLSAHNVEGVKAAIEAAGATREY
jgi:hypothetical protein